MILFLAFVVAMTYPEMPSTGLKYAKKQIVNEHLNCQNKDNVHIFLSNDYN